MDLITESASRSELLLNDLKHCVDIDSKQNHDKRPSEKNLSWNWAVEEQVRIGRVHIWLWRTKSPRKRYQNLQRLVESNVKIEAKEEKGNQVMIQIEDELVDVYVGSAVDLGYHTIVIPTDDKIEIGLKVVTLGPLPQSLSGCGYYYEEEDQFRLTKLNNRGVGRICCGRCYNELTGGLDEVISKWFRLPSEGWEEFIEYWVCHEDNHLKSTSNHHTHPTHCLRKPSKNEAFIGDWFLEFDLDWINRTLPQNHLNGKKISYLGTHISSPLTLAKHESDQFINSKNKYFTRCDQCEFTLGEIEENFEIKPNQDKSNCQAPVNMKRTIKLYKRSIILAPHVDPNGNQDILKPKFHLDLDDDLTGRAFEVNLLQNEVLKLIETNGFYKILIKNFDNSKSIGLWIFCPLVLINHSNYLNKSTQKLKRSKIMYVLFDDEDMLEDQRRMKIFENGAISNFDGSSKQRIGEIVLPLDHFDLLIQRLRSNSIYQITHQSLSRSYENLDDYPFKPPTLLDRGDQHQRHLNDQNTDVHDHDHTHDTDDADPLFMGIYKISYL